VSFVGGIVIVSHHQKFTNNNCRYNFTGMYKVAETQEIIKEFMGERSTKFLYQVPMKRRFFKNHELF
jgi:hypothetical protein